MCSKGTYIINKYIYQNGERGVTRFHTALRSFPSHHHVCWIWVDRHVLDVYNSLNQWELGEHIKTNWGESGTLNTQTMDPVRKGNNSAQQTWWGRGMEQEKWTNTMPACECDTTDHNYHSLHLREALSFSNTNQPSGHAGWPDVIHWYLDTKGLLSRQWLVISHITHADETIQLPTWKWRIVHFPHTNMTKCDFLNQFKVAMYFSLSWHLSMVVEDRYQSMTTELIQTGSTKTSRPQFKMKNTSQWTLISLYLVVHIKF